MNTDAITSTILERSAELRRISLRTRRLLNADLIGDYRSSFRGSGLNFSELREYNPGDDTKHIDWRASARTGKMYVKSFEEERQLSVIIAVDCSASTKAGAKGSLSHRAISFAALVAALAGANRDLCGLVLFSDQIINYLKPSNGRTQVQQIIRSLANVTPNGQTDISVALDHIFAHVKKHSILFIVSDFYANDFETKLRQASLRHDTILVAPELTKSQVPLANGIIQFQDPETGRTCLFDSSSRRCQAQLLAQIEKRNSRLTELADRIRADILFLGEDPLEPLISLMQRRKRTGH